jgi:hypothetical protein
MENPCQIRPLNQLLLPAKNLHASTNSNISSNEELGGVIHECDTFDSEGGGEEDTRMRLGRLNSTECGEDEDEGLNRAFEHFFDFFRGCFCFRLSEILVPYSTMKFAWGHPLGSYSRFSTAKDPAAAALDGKNEQRSK